MPARCWVRLKDSSPRTRRREFFGSTKSRVGQAGNGDRRCDQGPSQRGAVTRRISRPPPCTSGSPPGMRMPGLVIGPNDRGDCYGAGAAAIHGRAFSSSSSACANACGVNASPEAPISTPMLIRNLLKSKVLIFSNLPFKISRSNTKQDFSRYIPPMQPIRQFRSHQQILA